MRRRSFALGSLSALLPCGTLRAQEKRQLLGDMHSHATLFQRTVGVDLKREMEETGTSLVAWALVDDTPFTKVTPQGIKQVRQPEPGQLWSYFQQRVVRYDNALRAWNLPQAWTAAHVDAALQGVPQAVGFATDLEGAGPDPTLARYADLRVVADTLVRRGMPTAVLQDVCIGNYARVLKRAMAG